MSLGRGHPGWSPSSAHAPGLVREQSPGVYPPWLDPRPSGGLCGCRVPPCSSSSDRAFHGPGTLLGCRPTWCSLSEEELRAMAQGLFPLGFSFFIVTPSKQPSLTIASETAPVAALLAVLLRHSAQCMRGGQCVEQSGVCLGPRGPASNLAAVCVTSAKPPGFSASVLLCV